MKCWSCHFENREQADFCGKCGIGLLSICSRCEAQNPAANLFCDGCGRDLGRAGESAAIDFNRPRSYTPKHLADRILTTRGSIEGERKLVTVLFADVANYTSISEKLDPEEVHQIMNGCFRILVDEIYRCEGTIDKFTGDGVMALFGAPLAHEDHAQRAGYAALSIQKALGDYGEQVRQDWGIDFRVRIGLNSGLVVVDTIGDDLRMDYTAIGDTANLASRMESMARPGAILVSGHTHRLTRDFFEFEALGKLVIKGKEAPQEAYELLRTTEVQTRIEVAASKGLTRFVGRKREMGALRAAFEKARAGSGQVLVIAGDAGVGKSRLLREFLFTLCEEEHLLLKGRCVHHGASVVYLPVLGIVRSYFDIHEGDPEQGTQNKIREALRGLDEKLQAALPAFQDLLSLKVEDEAYLRLDPQQRKERVFQALRDLLVGASRAKPLVVAVEDLHWIDRLSQEFLDSIVKASSNASILFILLCRPEYNHSWANTTQYAQIGLDELSSRTSGELIEAILKQGGVAPDLKALILDRAGGNPLFLEELTRSLLENATIRRDNGQYVLARKASEIAMPETIKGIIAARMDRLGESPKRVLQMASVIGREFAFSILETITGISNELKALLLSLQDSELIYQKHPFPESAYMFKHALTQEVAYEGLLLKRRRQLHERIGRSIEEVYAERLEQHYEMLAYHYVHSDNTLKAVEYLDKATRKAANVGAMEESRASFDKAMELLDAMPFTEETRRRRVSLLVNADKLFFGLIRVREYHDLLARWESMATELEAPGLRGEFHAALAYCQMTLARLDEAIKTATRAVELCAFAGNEETAGYAMYISAFAHMFRADYEQALSLTEASLRITEKISNPRATVRASWIASVVLARMGRFDEAIAFGRKALAVEEHEPVMWGWGEAALSYTYTLKRDPVRAIELGERALGKAQTLWSRALIQHIFGHALCYAGRTGEGIELLTRLLQLSRAMDLAGFEITVSLYVAEGYWLAGEYGKGRQSAEDLLKMAEPCGERYEIGQAYFLMGETKGGSDPDRAATHFAESIAVFQEIKAENALAMAYAGFGRLHKRRDKNAEARDYLTRALEIFERLGTLIEPDKVRRELGDLPP